MCSTWNVLFPWLGFEKPQDVPRGTFVPSECSLNLNVPAGVLLRRLFKGTALRIKQKSVPRRTYMRRADCLAQRGRLTQNWLIRIIG